MSRRRSFLPSLSAPRNRSKLGRRRILGKIETLERREMMAVDVALPIWCNPPEPEVVVCGYDDGNSVAPLNLIALDDDFENAADLGTVHGMQSFSDWVGSTDTSDYYRFTLDDTTNVTLRLGQLSADIDLYLFDANGDEIARSWLGGSVDEQIEQLLGAGSYFARVSRWASAESNYEFSLDADLAGETFGDARDLGTVHGSHVFSDWVGQFDTNDYFRFVLDEAGEFTLRLDQLSSDIDLYLYDAYGNEMARSWLGGNANELIEGNLGAGTYYVRVTPWGSAESSYRLTLDARIAGQTFDTARDLGTVHGPLEFADWVGRTDTNDYYRFALDEAGDVTLRLDELGSDIDLYLYDANGNEITRSWLGGNADELIHQTLAAGTYYMRVTPWLSNRSTYHLSLDVDFGEDNNQEAFPDVPYFGGANDWNLNAVNAPEAWAQGHTGAGVIVAVIDTGVDYYHSDLFANMWTNDDIAGNGIDDDGNGYIDDYRGWDFSYGDNDPMDVHGHGTHVSGTIAAANNGFGATGVAFGALIMPVQVLDNGGYGSWEAVAAGIRYAVDNGADIINLSLGGGYSELIASALAYAGEMGVFVAAAAGNDGAWEPGYPAYHSGELSNVLSVGAHDVNNSLASFSNRVGGSGAVQIDAPGLGVYSTLPGDSYDSWSGTSMATPHVAGVAALALGANPNLTPSQLRQLLVDGATRSIFGSDSAGGLNAAMTVAMAVDGSATTEAGLESVFAPADMPQGPNALRALALDSLFATNVGSLFGSAAQIADNDCGAWMSNVPAATPECDLPAIAMVESEDNDENTSPAAAVDAVFESLWEDVELDSLVPQLV